MRHRLSLFVIMAILSLVSSVAYGFTLMKTRDDFVPLRWLNSDLPVGYRINGQNDDMTVQEAIDTITDSFATWGAVGSSSATSSYDGTTAGGGFNGSDGRNTISFDDPEGDLDSSILAMTMVWFYSGSDGNFTVSGGRVFDELTDADIVFNDADFTFVPGNQTPTGGQYDLQSVATHEIGHLFGLHHPAPSIPEATMHGTISVRETSPRTLHFDDEDGISYVYTSTPVVSGIEPATIAPEDTPIPLTINGTGFVRASQNPDGSYGFATGASVTIGVELATDVAIVSSTQITCVTPALAPGEYDVTVTNPDTMSGSLAGGLEVSGVQADADGDGLPDAWEADNGLNPYNSTGNNGADGDPDEDGLTNTEEYEADTDPQDWDTDDDLMPDGWEVQYDLNPTDSGDASEDADGDGYTNLEEFQGGSDPQDENDVPNQAPYAPDNPFPGDGQEDLPVDTDLTWRCGDPDEDELTFDIYFGDTYPPPLVQTAYNLVRRASGGYRPSAQTESKTLASAWPMHSQNIQRTGRSREVGPAFSDNVWHFSTGEAVVAPITTDSHNTLYTVTENGLLYAIDFNGEVRWTHACGGPVTSSPLISTDGTVYVVSDEGTLHAVSRGGASLWTLALGGHASCSPAIRSDGGVIYVTTEGRLHAVDIGGFIAWSVDIGTGATTSPSVGLSSEIYVGSESGALYRVNNNSYVDWVYQAGGAISSAPVIWSDGTVYFGCEDGNLYAVTADGVLKWAFRTDGPVVSSPVMGSDGGICFGSSDGSVYALTNGGYLRWSLPVGAAIRCTPTLDAESTIYVTTEDGFVCAIDLNGHLKWSKSVPGAELSSPVVGPDRCVYVGSSDGNLYGFYEAPAGNDGFGNGQDGGVAGHVESGGGEATASRGLLARLEEAPVVSQLRAAATAERIYSYPLPRLTPGAWYYWQIVVSDGVRETAGPDWSFRTSSAPTARFTVEPTVGTTDTVFHVDASTSSDHEDSIDALIVRWDWESDGTYDTDFTPDKSDEHSYSETGSYSIRLQVMDTVGLTDEHRHEVTVDREVLIILGTAVGLYGYAEEYDLNGDGEVNAMDAIICLQGGG